MPESPDKDIPDVSEIKLEEVVNEPEREPENK